MDEIATMSRRDRGQLFSVVADGARRDLEMDVSAGVFEKDIWVCWLMSKLFALPLAQAVEGACATRCPRPARRTRPQHLRAVT